MAISGACPCALGQESEAEEGAAPVFTPPSILEYHQAEYPPEAFEEGTEGVVGALLEVDENGLVTNVEITEPAGHGFDEAATDAMFQFVFAPATSGGEPTPSRVAYRYNFFIQKEAPPPEDLPPPVARLAGVVTDMDGEPLSGASIIATALDAGDRDEAMVDGGVPDAPADPEPAIADAEGRFELADLAPGSYQVDIVATGYKPFTSTEDLEENEDREVIYRLELEATLYETVVRGRRPPREVTRREITRREITRIPGTSGDALRAIQNLPGMARAPMGGGQLVVRGSAPGDSRVFFDQNPIPLIYHFGGLTSVINSDLLERIDYFPGNYGVRYGGATGGIIDVYPRAPATDRIHASLDADVWDLSVLAETPIGEDWSVAASFRRSYIDWILNAVLPSDGGFQMTVAPRYYDYQLVVDYHPGEKRSDKCSEAQAREMNRLSGSTGEAMMGAGAYIEVPDECERQPGKDHLRLFVFGSDDKMVFLFGDDVAGNPNFGGGMNFRTYFHQGQLRWDHRFNSAVSNEANVASGYWGMDSKFGEDFQFDQGMVPIFLRDEISIDAADWLVLRTGLNAEIMWTRWKIRAPMQNPAEGETIDPLTANDEFLETSGNAWVYNPAWYGEIELKPVERLRLMYGLRVDYYGLGKKFGLDPRFVARWEVIDGTTIKGGLGLFHQAPDYADWDDEYGNPDLDLIGSVHYGLGVEQRLFANIEIGLEGFYKDIFRLVVASDDTVTRGGQEVAERYNNDGRGKVYGMELLLKHHPTEKFFGWISYTLMRSSRIDHPGDEERPFDYDQTHILTVVASLVLGRGWEAGVRFRLVTGNPTTPVLGSTYDADSDIYWPLYGEINSDRLPVFHQLDIRIDKKWRLRNTIDFGIYLDIQNIYNHSNVEGFMYSYDYSQKVYFTGLPLLPSIGMKIEY